MRWSIPGLGAKKKKGGRTGVDESLFTGQPVTDTDTLYGDAVSLAGTEEERTDSFGHFSSLTLPWQQDR